MHRFLDRTKKIIFAQQGGIFSSALILAVMIVTSRIFGFLRYRILSGYYTKAELDIFFASFRIPDIIFEILITGALTSSFIPIFIRFQKNKKELDENISSIINLIIVFLIVFILFILIFLDKIIYFITPGFQPDKIALIVFYSRILLIGQLPFLVIGNILTGIGQANKLFFYTSTAPVVYNLVIIAATILLNNQFQLLAPVIGTIIGSWLFLVIQAPLLLRTDFFYRFTIKITSGLKDFFRMVVPRVFTVIVTQLDATIDLTLTSFLGTGSYTYFYLAQHLQLLPVSVIGIAFGQASLPYLTEMVEEKRMEEFKKVIIDTILNLFFMTIPAMSFFILARTPLIRLFFGGQKFDWESTVQTAITLSFFSLSIPFHSVYYFITRCFYATLDSKTPFYASLISIFVNTVLSLIFVLVLKLPVWALAISFSTSISVNVILLFMLLNKKVKNLDVKYLLLESAKMLVATVIASSLAYGLMKLLDGLILDTTRTINVFFLVIIGLAIYLLLYLFISWIIDVKEIYFITKLLMKAKEYRKKVFDIYTTNE